MLRLTVLPAAIAVVIYMEIRAGERESAAATAAEAAVEADRRTRFASGDFAAVFELCRGGWRDQLEVVGEPVALAWTRDGLDGYIVTGADASSWRQLRCDTSGVRSGPRVERPLLQLVPYEALPLPTDPGIDPKSSKPPGEPDAIQGTQGDLDVTPSEPEPTWTPIEGIHRRGDETWQLAMARSAVTLLAPSDLAVELMVHPLTGVPLVRRWSGAEAGALPQMDPADAPIYPLLIAEPRFPIGSAARPPDLRVLPRAYWLRDTTAAIAAIERALPNQRALISELTLTDDKIEISINSPTPAFDGKPPAPYGSLALDEHGIANSTWWYPYDISGFGCPTGRPLAEVAADLAVAIDAKTPGRLTRAWYSCSPAYSDGQTGVWNLLIH